MTAAVPIVLWVRHGDEDRAGPDDALARRHRKRGRADDVLGSRGATKTAAVPMMLWVRGGAEDHGRDELDSELHG